MGKLLDKINEGIADRNITAFDRDVIKAIKSEIEREKKDIKRDLSDDEEIRILKRNIKELVSASEEYSYKTVYVESCNHRIAILSAYLPKFMNREDTETIVNKVLAENQISMKKEFKNALSLVMEVNSNIDRDIVTSILKTILK